jgi:protein TorT
MDILVRALEGEPYLRHVGPRVEMVDRRNVEQLANPDSLAPRGFRPVFSVNDWVKQ